MRFNSLSYLVFLIGAAVLYRSVPVKARLPVLLALSLAFYAMWHWPYVALLLGVVALNTVGARWISSTRERGRRTAVVVGANLAVLAAFKYAGWLARIVDDAVSFAGAGADVVPVPRWTLPLGISFFLFEGMSYVIDVGRKREKPHGVLPLSVFIAFFPKLIAGPILRAKELLPQITGALPPLSSATVAAAVYDIVIGLFLKVVVADGIAQNVDAAWARDVSTLSAPDAWIMACGFGMQIYFDFSSYSRIAFGSARLLGIELVENFDHPYTATTPAAFWNRWHMSLSRWIRDYVFFPLTRGKADLASLCRAALISMTLCGLWHGAAFTFVLWGAWHGVLIAATHVAQHVAKKPALPPSLVRSIAGVAMTFPLVSLGWIFFRAADVRTAFAVFSRALSPWRLGHVLPGTMYLFVAVLIVAVLAGPRIEALLAKTRRSALGFVVDGIVMGLAVAGFLIYLRGQTAFIYFQF